MTKLVFIARVSSASLPCRRAACGGGDDADYNFGEQVNDESRIGEPKAALLRCRADVPLSMGPAAATITITSARPKADLLRCLADVLPMEAVLKLETTMFVEEPVAQPAGLS